MRERENKKKNENTCGEECGGTDPCMDRGVFRRGDRTEKNIILVQYVLADGVSEFSKYVFVGCSCLIF